MSNTSETPRPTFLALLQLIRAPNLFTAAADVLMGFLLCHGELAMGDGLTLILLVATSVQLYAGGVVLNDVCDYEDDCRNRPARPLPAGEIPLKAARWLTGVLLLGGLGSAVLAGLSAVDGIDLMPAVVALSLIVLIVLYNRYLKRTPLGPLAMGGCRMLNVLLGASTPPLAAWGTAHWHAPHWLAAVAVGVYVVGLTWLARNESGKSSRVQLLGATLVILLGMSLFGGLPFLLVDLAINPWRWLALLTMLVVLVSIGLTLVIFHPTPRHVQFAVREGLLTLIILDATVVALLHDVPTATMVLMLIVPAVLLGRWFAMT